MNKIDTASHMEYRWCDSETDNWYDRKVSEWDQKKDGDVNIHKHYDLGKEQLFQKFENGKPVKCGTKNLIFKYKYYKERSDEIRMKN